MKRSPILPKSSIKRSGPIAQKLSERKAPARKAAMKKKGPRMTPIRRAAEGQDCTLRIPGVCNFDPATTVLCHSPYLEDGRGMGIKSPDHCAVFGCNFCHDVLDGRRRLPEGYSADDLRAAFRAGIGLTHAELRRMKVISGAAPSVEQGATPEQTTLE